QEPARGDDRENAYAVLSSPTCSWGADDFDLAAMHSQIPTLRTPVLEVIELLTAKRRLLQLLALNPPRYGNPDRVLLPNVPAEVGKYSRCRPDAWPTKANQGRARFGDLAKKVPYSTFREDGMAIIRWTRRDVLKAASGAVAAGVFTSSMRAQAQQVK